MRSLCPIHVDMARCKQICKCLKHAKFKAHADNTEKIFQIKELQRKTEGELPLP